jgi:hypothetical protein
MTELEKQLNEARDVCILLVDDDDWIVLFFF